MIYNGIRSLHKLTLTLSWEWHSIWGFFFYIKKQAWFEEIFYTIAWVKICTKNFDLSKMKVDFTYILVFLAAHVASAYLLYYGVGGDDDGSMCRVINDLNYCCPMTLNLLLPMIRWRPTQPNHVNCGDCANGHCRFRYLCHQVQNPEDTSHVCRSYFVIHAPCWRLFDLEKIVNKNFGLFFIEKKRVKRKYNLCWRLKFHWKHFVKQKIMRTSSDCHLITVAPSAVWDWTSAKEIFGNYLSIYFCFGGKHESNFR